MINMIRSYNISLVFTKMDELRNLDIILLVIR